mgnify:FL=1
MANQYLDLVALTGVWGVPEEMHDEFIEFTNVHAEFMVEKSKPAGELELIHYWWAKNPRLADSMDMNSEQIGGYQFVLTELYRTEQGLRHHWVEASMFAPVAMEMVKRGLTVEFCNNGRVIHSLWG